MDSKKLRVWIMKLKLSRIMKVNVTLAGILLTVLLVNAILSSVYDFQNVGKIKAGLEDPLEAWSEASYIVWKYNSTHYAARNMSTLLIESNMLGTNATTIIQDAIDALTSGGTIFIKAGEYEISAEIQVTSKISLIGEGIKKTILKAMGNIRLIDTKVSTGTTDVSLQDIQFDMNNYGLDYSIHFTRLTRFYMQNLYIKDTTVNGLWMSASSYGYVENLIVENGQRDGITFATLGTDEASAEPSHHITVIGGKMINVNDCYVAVATSHHIDFIGGKSVFGSNTVYLIDFDGGRNNRAINVQGAGAGVIRTYTPTGWSEVASAYDNELYGVEFDLNGLNSSFKVEMRTNRTKMIGGSVKNAPAAGITISGGNDNAIEGVTFENITGDAVQVWAYYYDTNRNTISNNKFKDVSSYGLALKAEVGKVNDFSRILFNDFTGASSKFTKSGTVTNMQWRGNLDFPTEQSGTTMMSNDDWASYGVTFATTPQTIVLTVMESDANYIAQVKANNKTHFQIYLYDLTAAALETVDKTIAWYVVYRP